MQQKHYIAVLAACFGSVSLVLGFAAVLTWNQAGGARRTRALPVAENRRLLVETLEGMHRSWVGSERERYLARARSRTDAIEPALAWFLGLEARELTPEAAELCAELGLAALRPALVAIASSGKDPALRACALRAAERLSPWRIEELARFLKSDESRILRAALTVVRDREPKPRREILRLLVHAERDVRELALAALPSELSADERGALLGLARDAEDATGTTCLRALGRAGLDAEGDELLRDKLGERGAVSARSAVLAAFAAQGSALSAQSKAAAWEVFGDWSEPQELRAQALRCLELTGGFDAGELERHLPVLPPLLKYHAARCLLRAGRASGGEALLELCTASKAEGLTGGADAEHELAARHAARVLLSELTCTQVSTAPRRWERLLDEGRPLPTVLPPPRLER